jgi:hypothetical protein
MLACGSNQNHHYAAQRRERERAVVCLAHIQQNLQLITLKQLWPHRAFSAMGNSRLDLARRVNA